MTQKTKYQVSLPQTPFPMRGNLPQREPEWLAKWEADDLYAQVRKSREGAPLWILHDGPPYANGTIHLGHALNKILKDVIIKAKTLEGFDAPCVPGWDCHGLPIELKVEGLVGKPGVNVDAREFREKCRAYAAEQVELQKADFRRLGVLMDWHNPYLTMDFRNEAEIVRSLAALVKKGHMFKGHKPVYWCCDCSSALAEAEVEYRDKKSDSIYVAFAPKDKQEFVDLFGLDNNLPVYAVIWTTTPWTIPGNRAISFNPDYEYVFVKATVKDNPKFAEPAQFLVAKELVKAFTEAAGLENVEQVGKVVKGAQVEYKKWVHPLYGHDVLSIVGDHVGLDAGTGLVHTAPDNGLEDFEVCQKYNIPLANIINDDSEFKKDLEYVGGHKILESNGLVIKALYDQGKLLHKGTILHSYPHCWRHKTPVVYRATPQWFIGMDVAGLRQQVLNEFDDVKFVPRWGVNRITTMVETRPDWCISRQRTWGVPIPVFTHKETGELHPRTQEIFEQVAQLVEKQGIQAWWDVPDEVLLGEDAGKYTKAKDTLDVWFDSGATNQTVVKRLYNGAVADLYLEGSDQHRGWFMSSVCIGTGVTDRAPYREVLTHGFIVDGNGQKMSKSLGNTVAPQDVSDKYGADILRLWVAQADYTSDVRVSDEVLKRGAEQYRRVRNTLRFLLANLDGFDPEKDLVPTEQLLPVDRYVLALAGQLQEELRKDYSEYHLHLVVKKLLKFCSVDLGSFYLDVTKDRMYCGHKESRARKSAQTTMFHLAEALVRWVSPILSFTAQEAWELLPGQRDKYVFTAYYYDKLVANNTAFDQGFWEVVRKVREEVNLAVEALRDAKEVGSSLDAQVELFVSRPYHDLLKRLGNEAKFAFLVSGVELKQLYNLDLEARPEFVALQAKDPEAAAALKQRVADTGVYVYATKHPAPKCELTWHHDVTVGQNPEHPTLSARAVANLFGEGEVRRFV